MALGGVGDFVLFYNKKDFAKAGISGPPATWTQLEADAVKLSDPAKHHYGIYIPFGTDEWISYDWESLLWANGGQFLNSADTKTAFDSPAGVQALTTWVDLVRKDHAAPTTSFAEAGSYDGAPAFSTDAVSMIVDGQWAVSEFATAKSDFGVALVPAGTSGHSASNIGIGVATVFSHNATADAAATTFVQWLAQPAQGAYLTATSGGLPSCPGSAAAGRGPEGGGQRADLPDVRRRPGTRRRTGGAAPGGRGAHPGRGPLRRRPGTAAGRARRMLRL
jgi:ABC-type glycerol-3-phosphate transport system substrate-binding protein